MCALHIMAKGLLELCTEWRDLTKTADGRLVCKQAFPLVLRGGGMFQV